MFFDPQHPNDAVVDKALCWNHWFMAAAALLLLVGAQFTPAGFRVPFRVSR